MNAAVVLDGAVNRDEFDAYVEQMLLPTPISGQVDAPSPMRLTSSGACSFRLGGVPYRCRQLDRYAPYRR
jgi:hypothetical protein